MPKISNKKQAILLVICTAFCFATMNTFARLAGDLPSLQKAFFRNMIAMFFAATMLWRQREILIQNLATINKHWGGLILRSIFGTLGVTCNYYAIDHMLLADASILNRLSPFVTVFLCWLFLHEKIDRIQAASIATAFIGALCIIRPGFGALTSWPALIATLGGCGAGAAYTMVRYLTGHGVNKPFIIFFFSAFSCLVLLPPMLLDYHPMTGQQLMFLLLAGLFAAGGQICITYAYSKAPSREISVFDYTIVIFAAIYGFLLFDQIPDILSFVGYAIIIGIGTLMFFHNNQRADKPTSQTAA